MIEQAGGPPRDAQRGEKPWVEPFSADHIKRLFADSRRAYCKQPESRATRQFLALKERPRRSNGRWDRRFGISKLCLPLRRRQDCALMIHQFQKVEVLLTGLV